IRPRRSIERAAWKPNTARRVTQMRSLGTMLSTSVQADRHGPSMTTRSPEFFTFSKRSMNGPTWPPGLARIRTSARASMVAKNHSATATNRVKTIRITLMCPSSVSPLPPQRRQSDARGIETAVDREHLAGDVARALAAPEEDGLRQFLFKAVAVERYRIVIIGTDFRRMYGLCHRGVDGPRRHRVDPDARGGQFHRELFGEMGEPRLAGAIGRSQGRSAHRRDRSDVDDGAAMLAHQRDRSLRAQERPGQGDCEHAAPVIVCRLHDGCEHRHSGLVDE